MIKKELIKKLATELGFFSCGISAARKLVEQEKKLEQWLKNNYHGKMQYMENYFDKRLDPTLLVPGAKTVISILFNYFPSEAQKQQSYKIAKYAYGVDYHEVIKNKLHNFVNQLTTEFGNFEGRFFVDSAPIMERQWAALSGLGWIGKNSLLIQKQKGSFFFIAQLICDLEIETDLPTTDHCGTCTACIDACPTNAIVGNQIIDAKKCISYLTIELKNEIPHEFSSQLNNYIFGCDICQDVCPWNKFSEPTVEKKFTPQNNWLHWDIKDFEQLTHELFLKTFGNSAMRRTGFKKLKQNIATIIANNYLNQ